MGHKTATLTLDRYEHLFPMILMPSPMLWTNLLGTAGELRLVENRTSES